MIDLRHLGLGTLLFAASFGEAASDLGAGAKTELLLSQDLQLGSEAISLRIERTLPQSPSSSDITAHFIGKRGRNLGSFELDVPVFAEATAEVPRLGAAFPPSVFVTLRGGADGSSQNVQYVFSLFGQKVAKTFSEFFEDVYYFRTGSCGKLVTRADGTPWVVAETSELKMTSTPLIWDARKRRLVRGRVETDEPFIRALRNVPLYAKPLHPPTTVRTAARGEQLHLLGAKICDGRKDGSACEPEPAEKARWFRVRDRSKRVYWMWEGDAGGVESNLACYPPVADF